MDLAQTITNFQAASAALAAELEELRRQVVQQESLLRQLQGENRCTKCGTPLASPNKTGAI